MTEREKMSTGLFYDPADPQLCADRLRAKKLTFAYNNTAPEEDEKRLALLKELLHSMGNDVWIEQPFKCEYGYNTTIGHHFFSNYNLMILDINKVTIGNHVMLAPNVGLYTATHPIHPALRREHEYGLPITIEDDVWIGAGTTVNPGVTIGRGSVIGAGSVVTKDIPPNVVAVGNPCKVLRPITEEDREKVRFSLDEK